MAARDVTPLPKAPLVVRLMGGLGNQLFQYAFGRACASRIGAPLAIDARYVRRKNHHTGLAIEAFNIQAEIADAAQLARFADWKIRIARGLRQWHRPLWGQYHEWGLQFDPQASNRQPGELVSGFWQTERYFSPIRQQLLTELTLKNEPTAALEEMSALIKSSPLSVAVHIRRGDYVSNALAAKRHGLCSSGYYELALRTLQDRLAAAAQLFVFTDDLPWCKTLAPLNRAPQVTWVQGFAPEHDLLLMSQCRHQIIANSSFSWWGAWLNRDAQAIRIAPAPWNDDPSLKNDAIAPSGWLRVPKNP